MRHASAFAVVNDTLVGLLGSDHVEVSLGEIKRRGTGGTTTALSRTDEAPFVVGIELADLLHRSDAHAPLWLSYAATREGDRLTGHARAGATADAVRYIQSLYTLVAAPESAR